MCNLPKPDDASLISPAATVSSGAVESVPDEFPDRCTRCGTTAPAVDGRCPNPKCRCSRKGTQLAAKGGPVNVAKRDQLRARFIQDYRPSTTIDEIRCRELADITERLSTLKKGSSEYVRLVQTMASLDEALRSARSIQQPPDFATLSNEELIARLETLLASAREVQRKPEPAERAVAEPEAASEAALGPRSASIANPTGQTPAEKESAAPSPSVILQSTRSSPIEPTPEEAERRAAAIRRELGWDQGVMNETKGYRYRE